jgi:hypothetical protein
MIWIPSRATWLKTNQRADKKSPRQNTSAPDLILSRRISEDFELINISCLKPVEKPVDILLMPDSFLLTNPDAHLSTTLKTGFQQLSQPLFLFIISLFSGL